MTKGKIDLKENEVGTTKYWWRNFKLEFCRKWSKFGATIVASVAFVLLVVVVFLSRGRINCFGNYNNVRNNIAMRRSVFENVCVYSQDKNMNCIIYCNGSNNYDIEIVKSNILRISNENTMCKEYIDKLTLDRIIFPKEVLVKDWWFLNISIVRLILDSSNLYDIEPGAFDKKEFSVLKELTINAPSFKLIRKGAFRGISNLDMLQIDGSGNVMFESDVLDGFVPLTRLQISDSLEKPESLKNLVGTSILTHLELLSIADNKLLRSLLAKTFSTPKLRSLYAMNCALTVIDPKAFDGLSMLQLLHLNGNNLHTLEEFSDVPKTLALFIGGNPWECYCGLEWIKMWKINDSVSCHSPEGVNFFGDNFCGTTTDGTTIMPTITISSTDENESTTSTLVTEQSETSSTFESTTATISSTEENESTTTSTSVTEESETSSTTTTISSTDENESTTNSSSVTEESETSSTVESTTTTISSTNENGSTTTSTLVTVESGTTPTVESTTTTISSTDGSSRTESEMDVWLKNYHKLPVIVGAVATMLVECFAVAVAVYCCLKKHPSLLGARCSANVSETGSSIDVIQSRKLPDPPIRMRMREYLTPVGTRSTLVRTSSDCSSASSTHCSYVQAIEPTSHQFVSWRCRTAPRCTSHYCNTPSPPPRRSRRHSCVHYSNAYRELY